MNYFRKRHAALKYAFKGLNLLFRDEPHARIHLTAGLLVLILAWFLHVNIMEWLVLILCITGVVGMEAINSAVEKLTNIAAPDFSEKAGQVKDVAAGAVLIVSIGSAFIGFLIFIPKIASFIKIP